MITGLMTPSINRKIVYPEHIFEEVQEDWIIDGASINQVFEAFYLKSKYFLQKLDHNFVLLTYVIRTPDCITHHPYIKSKTTKQTLESSYRIIDSFLGKLIKKGKISNLFIQSDHGLKKYYLELNLRRVLEKKKILYFNNNEFSKFLSLLVKIFGIMNIGILSLNMTYLHNTIRNRFKNLFDRKGPSDNNDSKQKEESLTKFIHFYSNYGGIILGDQDSKKKDLINKKLVKIKYIDHIYRYNNPNMPDFIIKLKEKYLLSVKSSFFKLNRSNSFNHSDKGLFIAYGENIKNIKSLGEVNYLDFAPTILKLYNLNVPHYINGNSLKILK